MINHLIDNLSSLNVKKDGGNYNCIVLDNLENVHQFAEAIPNVFLVLNQNNQIVFSNKLFHSLIEEKKITAIYGTRRKHNINPHDLVHLDGTCPDADNCSFCGAVNTYLTQMDSRFSVQECSVETKDGELYDFRVYSTPYYQNGEIYSFFSLSKKDESRSKSIMEQIFFNSILDSKSGLKGFAELLKLYPDNIDEYKDLIYGLSQQIIEEIDSQQIIGAAENGTLKLKPENIDIKSFLKEIENTNNIFAIRNKVKIDIKYPELDISFNSDKFLLKRVISNLLKKAIETCVSIKTVTLKCSLDGRNLIFDIHNDSYLNKLEQMSLFQRSFTTSGMGSGLGTYSIKLLTEKFLNGEVGFNCDINNGTNFYIKFYISEKEEN